MNPSLIRLALPGLLFVAAVQADDATPQAVLQHYADLAYAGYADALQQAQALNTTIDQLLATPNADTLHAARTAWLAARVPYQQTEVFRFGNPLVDAWEGKVNAWPLDEGLIDYVADTYGESAENPAYSANVIANPTLQLGSTTIDASTLDKTLLATTLHELGGIEANVATGYHAIEFLLWGQDLNGTGPGAGQRPASDFDPAHCTHDHCKRRAQYLKAAVALLVDDLSDMSAQWAAAGAARRNLLDGDPNAGLTAIVTGIGSLAYGELAGERMKLGLMVHDPEEEQDCFSDNTHHSHYYDVQGMVNVYNGHYTRVDGSTVSGPGLAALVAKTAPALDQEMQAKLQASHTAMQQLVERAQSTEAYDQMIGPDNPAGNAVVQAAIDALTAQTRTLEKVVSALKLEPIAFAGSDSLDNPAAVFQ